MALIKCKECGNQISDKAKMCPQCGASKPEPKNYGCGTLIFILIMPGIIYSVYQSSSSSSPQPPKTAEEIHKQKLEKGFNKWDGSHIELTMAIQQLLKDPKSYEHIETRYVDNKDGTLLVTTRYRAKNSFGGYQVGMITAKASVDGSLIEVLSVSN